MKADESSLSWKEKIRTYYEKLNQNGKGKLYIGLVVAIIIGISVFAYSFNRAYMVKIDGKVVATVRNKEDFTKIIDDIKGKLNEVYKQDITFDEKIVYEPTKADDTKLTDSSEIKKSIQRLMDFEVKSYAIEANGGVIVAVGTKKEAQNILDKIKKSYVEDEKTFEKVGFMENVKVTQSNVKINALKDEKSATELILQGTEEKKIHEVQKGESFWTIARKYKLTVDDLIKANKDADPEKIQIGQKLNLMVPKPLLTVETVEKVEYEEAIPYEIEFEETSALYKGDKKIKQEGKDGKRQVVAEIIKHNGIESSKKVLNEKITEQPTKQIVLKGTKNPPPSKGTGKLSNPTSRAMITSRFGWRWGKIHTGIDIGVRMGTPVKAADGGVVVYAGYKGGYGKCVIIDHGSNTKTLYAHNSQILVKSGQKVYKGQVISKSGNTGNSTGPHLHFEVRKNNKPVNPLGYVRY